MTVERKTAQGLLVIDKPRGITSRDAVNRVQGWFPTGTRIGHTGTLDPLASGVLVLCVGRATRLAEYVQAQKKTYHTRLGLGAFSNTDDTEGVLTPVDVRHVPTADLVQAVLGEFVGEIDQVPPAHSAIKVQGRRAYELARRGRDVPLAARRVHIENIQLLHYAYPSIELRISCGEGTYIRSLARDIGRRLACGGYVESLRRLQVGPFQVENAVTLDAGPEAARTALLPLAAAFNGPTVLVNEDQARKLRQGQRLEIPATERGPRPQLIAALDQHNEMIAVCAAESREDLLILIPKKVIPQGA